MDYTVQDILKVISHKRGQYIIKNGNTPNLIVMPTKFLMAIKLYYVYMIDRRDDKTLFGMEIIIDNSIEEPEDIKVYYKESEKYAIC